MIPHRLLHANAGVQRSGAADAAAMAAERPENRAGLQLHEVVVRHPPSAGTEPSAQADIALSLRAANSFAWGGGRTASPTDTALCS